MRLLTQIILSMTILPMLVHSSDTTLNRVFIDPATGMEFVHVTGGCFQMGDTFGEGNPDEKPVHEVCIDDFYIGKYEVTQGEYKQIIGKNPSLFKQGDRYPVERVSWYDTQDFIEKLNSRSSQNYRLPTEAEWEYAAREGGKKVRFGTGSDTIGSDEANFNALAEYKVSFSRSGTYLEETVEVGSYPPNRLGIHDMSGNLWEWCQDWYDEDYYKSSPRNNPKGPPLGNFRMLREGSWTSSFEDVVNEQTDDRGFRVIRGGSWAYQPWLLRATNRNYYIAYYRGYNIGFRIVRPVH